MMGYGTFSANYSFVPRTQPFMPPNPPRNRRDITSKTILSFEYDVVLETGGDTISSYMAYVDDGTNSGTFTQFDNGLSTLFRSDSFPSLSLTAGLIYRVKYSSVNAAGESVHSLTTPILLAQVPD